uniref:Uncharacterized protein n=1 Tax=Timema bartmani TaxID=61472 RepID=A0A7R9EZB6_9NEOP|nr:unnamed protein product [Timema bartmani]
MMIETPYLCVLYVSTAGQQGPGLGTDEEEIVLLVYVVIDMGQNKRSERNLPAELQGSGSRRWVDTSMSQ